MEEHEIDELSRILFYEFNRGEYEVFRLEVLNRKIKTFKQRIEQAKRFCGIKMKYFLQKLLIY